MSTGVRSYFSSSLDRVRHTGLGSIIRITEEFMFLYQPRWNINNTFEKMEYNHHHHHVTPPARISPTLSCHPSLSSIASGRSSRLHPVSAHYCCIYVLADRPAFARPCEGVHRSMSLMNSSLLLRQCPVCLVRLTWIVFVMGGRWLYSCCFVGCYIQDLFNIARSILV